MDTNQNRNLTPNIADQHINSTCSDHQHKFFRRSFALYVVQVLLVIANTSFFTPEVLEANY